MNDLVETAVPQLPADTGPASVLRAITDLASRPGIDIQAITALVDLHRSMQADEAKRQFNEAFARLKLPRITKKGEVRYPIEKNNPQSALRKAFSYARWEDIDEIIRDLLSAEGFSLDFDTEPQTDGRIVVSGMLRHVGGGERVAKIGPLPLDTSGGKNNIQALGSTFSYGKRYCGTMLLNLVFEGEDDDGKAGGTILIDAHTVKKLSDLIMTIGEKIERFLKYMAVESLADIEVSDLPRAMNALFSKMTPEQAEKLRREWDKEGKK